MLESCSALHPHPGHLSATTLPTTPTPVLASPSAPTSCPPSSAPVLGSGGALVWQHFPGSPCHALLKGSLLLLQLTHLLMC